MVPIRIDYITYDNTVSNRNTELCVSHWAKVSSPICSVCVLKVIHVHLIYIYILCIIISRGDHSQYLAARWQRLGDEEMNDINEEDQEEEDKEEDESQTTI